MKQLRDVTQYIHKPARVTRACLRSARDCVQEVHRRSEEGQSEPVLIAEVHNALVRFGRELRTGEQPHVELSGAVPDEQDISWKDVCLTTSDCPAGPAPCMNALVDASAAAKVAESVATKEQLLAGWTTFLAEEEAAKRREEEERAAREAEELQRREARMAHKEEKQKKKAEDAARRARDHEAQTRELALQRQQQQEEKWKTQREAQERKRQEDLQRQRVADYKARIKKSKYRCNCGLVIHRDTCRVRDAASNRVMWPGADYGLSEEQYLWCAALR